MTSSLELSQSSSSEQSSDTKVINPQFNHKVIVDSGKRFTIRDNVSM